MSLLLGGDQVKKAEAEAVDFYGRRIELIDTRMDTVHSDLAEKRANKGFYWNGRCSAVKENAQMTRASRE